jgi:hypothetical protein
MAGTPSQDKNRWAVLSGIDSKTITAMNNMMVVTGFLQRFRKYS